MKATDPRVESTVARWTLGTRSREQVIAAMLGRFELRLGEPRGHMPNDALPREQQRPLGGLRLAVGLSLARPWPDQRAKDGSHRLSACTT